MSFLGSRAIDEVLTFRVNTHNAGTGAAADADSVPSYRVYEDETGTPLLTGSMAKQDDSNTLGFYSEAITLSAANGFERGKSYGIRVEAAVDSVTGAKVFDFQIGASVNVGYWGGTAPNALQSGRVDSYVGAMGTNTMTAAAAASDLTTELQSGLATAANLATVDTVVDAIKAKTDSLTFTSSGKVDSTVLRVGTTDLTEDGTGGQGYGGSA